MKLNIFFRKLFFSFIIQPEKDIIEVWETESHCFPVSHISMILEVFLNEILAAWLKGLNVEVILISEFMNSEIRISSKNCRIHSYFLKLQIQK